VPQQNKHNRPINHQNNNQVNKIELTHHAGPLPDPATIERYEQIHPGYAERILVMAEKEQDNRHKNDQTLLSQAEKQSVRNNVTFRIGQFLAFLSVLSVVSLCIFLINNNAVNEAAWVAGTVIVALATAFVVNNKINK
jgi:uncharacterized membrane protein